MDSALFIGWGATNGGRERKSVELFGHSLRYLTGLVEQGRVFSVEPFFLEPHGGDLEGFLIVRGVREERRTVTVPSSLPVAVLPARNPPSVNGAYTTRPKSAGVPRIPPSGSNPPSWTDQMTGFGRVGSSFIRSPIRWSRANALGRW